MVSNLAHNTEWSARLSAWAAGHERRDLLLSAALAVKVRAIDDLRSFRDLFPEFTPHDTPLHADRLMQMADAIMPSVLSNLAVVEYLILLLAVYTHDWGMVLSKPDRSSVASLAITVLTSEPQRAGVSSLHHQDATLLLSYLKGTAGTNPLERLRSMADPDWAGYVRATHAQRSGMRVTEALHAAHGRFAHYTALVVSAHTLSKEEVADDCTYLLRAGPVLDSAPVNLQALAVYLRLLDLFDLSDERTPYCVWKAVQPHSPSSVAEWSRHLSMAPVVLNPSAQSLEFQGTATDSSTWAAVNDLREYCEDQFRFSQALLAKHPDHRYRLQFSWLDWAKLRPDGVCKDIVRFTFDRDATLTLLSGTVYGHDPYIFIRELLQNAIDATMARQHFSDLHNSPLAGPLPVEIDCSPAEEGDYTFTIADHGTGMTRFIITQFLSVVGRSYYRSPEFERLGITYDPISQFGIGLLSCFMVADAIEILTRPDPSIYDDSQAFRILITDRRNHWSLQHLPPDAIDIGTIVRVSVSAQKVAALQSWMTDFLLKHHGITRSQLRITAYLKAILGFPRSPVLVRENGSHTAILHPSFDEGLLPPPTRETYHIHRLGLTYPWERAFTPGAVPIAKRRFRYESLDLRRDLGLSDVDGTIGYLVPHDTTFHMTERTYHDLTTTDGVTVYAYEPGFVNRRAMSLCDSGARDPFVACYANGFLIPRVKYPPQLSDERQPDGVRKGTRALTSVYLQVNVTGRSLLLNRAAFSSHESWSDRPFDAVEQRLISTWRDRLLEAKPDERFRLLSHLGQFYPVSLYSVADAIGIDEWPICFLHDGGRVDVRLWRDAKSDAALTLPAVILAACGVSLQSILFGMDSVVIPWLSKWAGAPAIAALSSKWVGCSHYRALSLMPLLKLGAIAERRWISPPHPFLPPISLDVWHVPAKRDVACESTVDTVAPGGCGQQYTRSEMERIAKGWCEFDYAIDAINPRCFNHYCFWGGRRINVMHPFGGLLFRIMAALDCEDRRSPALEVAWDRIRHWFDRFFDAFSQSACVRTISFEELDRRVQTLGSLLRDVDCSLADQVSGITVSTSDFLPGAFLPTETGHLEAIAYSDDDGQGGISLPRAASLPDAIPWGHLLGHDSPWPSWSDLALS